MVFCAASKEQKMAALYGSNAISKAAKVFIHITVKIKANRYFYQFS